MYTDYIKSLKEALLISPENNPLRLLLADALIKESHYADAEAELRIVLSKKTLFPKF